jgi:polyhydroxyalkanoate synthesis regulator phasin
VSDPLEALLVNSTETTHQAILRSVRFAHGLNDAGREKLCQELDRIVAVAEADSREQAERDVRELLEDANLWLGSSEEPQYVQVEELRKRINEWLETHSR